MKTDRTSLINGLAQAMGAGTFAATEYHESKFDLATGTLYCNGHIISARTIDKAKTFLKNSMKRCDRGSSAGNEMYMIYETALESIKYLQRQSKYKDGNTVIKKTEFT
jgi:hypothetical protein